MNQPPNARLAVLVDADNAQSSVIPALLGEVARHGVATVKRVYGDWTKPNLKGWKERLNEYALQPIQQFSYTPGKNSTDLALIIDAMDLLHSGRFDGFCLVSSDSDFTRLATRIREAGLVVYGFGETKTPKPFVAACDEFIYTEILHRDEAARPSKPAEQVRVMLREAVQASMRDDGWSLLSAVDSLIRKTNPDFDRRKYGFRKLGDFVRAQPFLEVKPVNGANGGVHLHVRLKEGRGQAAPTA